MSKRLQSKYNNPKRSDFTVIIGFKTLNLHKAELDHSEYFETLMDNENFQEGNLSTVDLSSSPFRSVLEPMFKYLYDFPIEVRDSELGILWSAFCYFQIEDDAVIEKLIDVLPHIRLDDYHSVLRELMQHYGNENSNEVIKITLVQLNILLQKYLTGFIRFFDEFDYGTEFLWEKVLDFFQNPSLAHTESEKKFICNSILSSHLFQQLGYNHPLIFEFVKYIGKIGDEHLLEISDNLFDLEDETIEFFKDYVKDYLLEIDPKVLTKLSFSPPSSVSELEFKQKIAELEKEISSLRLLTTTCFDVISQPRSDGLSFAYSKRFVLRNGKLMDQRNDNFQGFNLHQFKINLSCCIKDDDISVFAVVTDSDEDKPYGRCSKNPSCIAVKYFLHIKIEDGQWISRGEISRIFKRIDITSSFKRKIAWGFNDMCTALNLKESEEVCVMITGVLTGVFWTDDLELLQDFANYK